MAWGSDPLVSADEKPAAAPPPSSDTKSNGWGKGKLIDMSHEDGTLTPGQAAAQAFYAGKKESGEGRVPGSAEMSLLQGATFGLGDEITGGTAALGTAITNAADYIRGKKSSFSPGEAYDAARDQARANDKPEQFQKDYPGGNKTGLEVMGGFAAPGVSEAGRWISQAPGVLSKVARGAMTSAGVGGITGFGSGQDGFANRAGNAGIGSVLGGVVGAVPEATAGVGKVAGPYLMRAGKAFLSTIKDISGKTLDEAEKMMSPAELKTLKDRALQIVHETLQSGGKTPEHLTEDPAFKAGKPVTAAEAGGNNTSAMLTSLGRRDGETSDAAESFFRRRGMERSERIQNNLAQATSLKLEHVQGNMEDLSDTLRAANPALYAKAEAHPPVDVDKDKELKHLFSSDFMQKGLKFAEEISQRRGLPWGYSMADRRLSWKQLDLVKRGLNTALKRETPSDAFGNMKHDDMSRAGVDFIQNFTNHLRKLNPDYASALDHAGEPLRLEKVYKEAPKYMGLQATSGQFDKWLNDMTPAEFDAAKAGWTNDIYNRLRKDKLRPKDLQSPEFIEKAERLLGAKQARQFVGEVSQEMRLREGENKIPPRAGSATARNLHAAEQMDEKTDEMVEDLFHSMHRRGVKFAVSRAAINAVYNVFQATKTPERKALRDEIGKLLLLRPDQLRQRLEAQGKVVGGTKQKALEIAAMMHHVWGSSSGPAAETAVQESSQ